MRTSGFWSGCLLAVSLLANGCGGGKPAESAESPAPAADAPGAEEPKAAEAKPAEAKPEASKESKPSPPVDDGPKPTRTAQDILTAPDVVFLFSFNDSEPKQVAEEKCSQNGGDSDPKKKSECMAAARKKFPQDGHRFKKDEQGQWWWLTVRQDGNRLLTLHKIPVEFGEQTATSITLKPTGKDKGSAPMKPPAKIVFEVPNDYQIALKDPQSGRLVYQAKIGIVTE